MISPKKLRGPKGRVMYGTLYRNPHNRGILTPIYHGKIPELDQIPVAVIPASSAKAARQIVKLHARSEEELINAVIDGWCESSSLAKMEIKARAVLAALGLKGRDR